MASKPNPKFIVLADKIATEFSYQILDENVKAEPKFFVGNSDQRENLSQGEDSDEMIGSHELIEMIEVDESWVDRCIEDHCNDETETTFDVDEIRMSEGSDDQVDLIEVGEDWAAQNLEDNEAGFRVAEASTDTSSDVCVRDLDRIAAMKTSVKETKWIRVAEASTDTSSGVCVRDLDCIAAMKTSLKETKGNSNFIKKGSVRKRRTFQMPLKQRLAIKKQILEHEHKVRRACKHDDCNSIDSKRRLEINKEFWEMPFRERNLFGLQSIHRSDVKYRRNGTTPRKANHNDFFLINEAGEAQQVCKIFYLTTLGFSKQNDSFIRTAVGKEKFKKPLPRLINRVDNLKLEIPNYASIIAHIKSFDPNVSHYRRVHAPKRKYLPETLTIRAMFADFQNEHGDVKCSYYLYRRIVTNELNISFAKLGHEQCETCEEYILHKKSSPMCTSCDLCDEYQLHKIKYTEARQLYAAQRLLNTEKKAFFSGDMEKVIMLPRLEMFKQAIFTTRLSAYNDTFAPLGGMENNPSTSKPIAIVWHEGISGRCKEDIISAFLQFFLLKRDVDEFVMWLDNCSSQNKNWALFTFLVFIINSDLISAHKIQFNYFEPGHTFMSADSFHKQVENSLDKMDKVYDFGDFETAVSRANSGNVTVIPMKFSNFYKWQDHSSKTKKQNGHHYMHEIVQVTATRGSSDLLYKKSFCSDEEFILDFLQAKFKKNGIPCPVQATNECGISKERKGNILKLSRILKDGKSQFYRNLTVSSVVAKREISGTEQPKSNAKLHLAVASEAEVSAIEQPASVTDRHQPMKYAEVGIAVALTEQHASLTDKQQPMEYAEAGIAVAVTEQPASVTDRHQPMKYAEVGIAVALTEQHASLTDKQQPMEYAEAGIAVAVTEQPASITDKQQPMEYAEVGIAVEVTEQPASVTDRHQPMKYAEVGIAVAVTEQPASVTTDKQQPMEYAEAGIAVAVTEQPASVTDRHQPMKYAEVGIAVALTEQHASLTDKQQPMEYAEAGIAVAVTEQPASVTDRHQPMKYAEVGIAVAVTEQSASVTDRHQPMKYAEVGIAVAVTEQPASVTDKQQPVEYAEVGIAVAVTEQPASVTDRHQPMKYAEVGIAVAVTEQPASVTDRHQPMKYAEVGIAVAVTEQPASVTTDKQQPMEYAEAGIAVAVTEQPKSRAGRKIRVTCKAKAAATEQQKSKSLRQIRAASKADAVVAEQPKLRAGKHIRVDSEAKSTATEQPKSIVRQPKTDTKKMVKKAEPKPRQTKSR